MHAVLLLADDELGEDRCEPGIARGTTDVVLAGGGRRGVDDQLVGRGVVGRGGEDRLHVGAVAGLGHREAPGQRQVGHAGQVLAVVALGAEVGDGPTEEAELHARLDEDGQVAVADHLQPGDRGPDVTRATEVDRQGRPDELAVGECGDELEGARPVRLEVEPQVGLGDREARVRAQLLPDGLPSTVEDGSDLLGDGVLGLLGAHAPHARRCSVVTGTGGALALVAPVAGCRRPGRARPGGNTSSCRVLRRRGRAAPDRSPAVARGRSPRAVPTRHTRPTR